MTFRDIFMNKTVAYLRVSTIDQDLEKNKADILHLANEKNFGKVHFVEETVSGKITWQAFGYNFRVAAFRD